MPNTTLKSIIKLYFLNHLEYNSAGASFKDRYYLSPTRPRAIGSTIHQFNADGSVSLDNSQRC